MPGKKIRECPLADIFAVRMLLSSPLEASVFTQRLPRIIAAVDSHIPWPLNPVFAEFDGHDFMLAPETVTAPDRIEMEVQPGEDHPTAMAVLNRFMSALAWVEGKKLRAASVMGIGHPQGGMGKGNARFNCNGLAARTETLLIDYLPAPTDAKAQLALALYREALGCDSIPYAFLGFTKILNMMGKSKAQKAWINQAIPKLIRNRDYEASRRIAQLSGDLGEYIYNDGRCAVAHAETGTVVNPDLVTDERRLAEDMPVVRALAEYFIEYELGVKSQETVWHEHLYELDGFRSVLGPVIVGEYKARRDVDVSALPQLPPLGLRIRDGETLKSLTDLAATWRVSVNGSLCLQLANAEWPVLVNMRLNFAEERLGFDPTTLVAVTDMLVPEAKQVVADRAALMRGLLRNKQLHVFRTDTGGLMGRTDGFLPDDQQWHAMKALAGVA